MPVYQLVEMPYDELLGWFEYFEVRPVGWRDDDRTMKLLQVQGVKAAPTKIFASLAKIEASQARARATMPDGMIATDNLKRSAFFTNMLGAVGGDRLEF